jgi:diketogulonate reductase-like aldo/keto reductase
MEQRSLGASLVAAIGQGTWRMEQDDPGECVRSLRRGLDLGMNHIDTAELYGHGAVEPLVAQAIAGRREEVFLASKVLPHNASERGTINACEQSLARLKTDHLDLYLLHWEGSHPLVETISAFERLVQAGKIRAYGVSNFDVERLEEAVQLAGPGKIACNQVYYSLAERAVEARLLPACQRLGVALVAYSPFGSGEFPGKPASGAAVLRRIAEQHGASMQQVALRFLLRTPEVLVIPKAARAEHAEDNARADSLALNPGDISVLDAAFPMRPKRRLPTL